MTLVLAVAAGVLIGLSLGTLGGGSILAVPVLVYLLDQSATQATTGSLVVVGVTSLIGAVTAHRAGNVLLGRGVVFGTVAIGGAALGAKAATRVSDDVLLAAFAALTLLFGGLMAWRQLRHTRGRVASGARPALDNPIITFSPTLACNSRSRAPLRSPYPPAPAPAPTGTSCWSSPQAPLAAVLGARLAHRLDTNRLQGAFTVLVLAVAIYTAARVLPALL